MLYNLVVTPYPLFASVAWPLGYRSDIAPSEPEHRSAGVLRYCSDIAPFQPIRWEHLGHYIRPSRLCSGSERSKLSCSSVIISCACLDVVHRISCRNIDYFCWECLVAAFAVIQVVSFLVSCLVHIVNDLMVRNVLCNLDTHTRMPSQHGEIPFITMRSNKLVIFTNN